MPPKADVRRLLKKQQIERSKTQKITHPFAKYDAQSRLTCIVCNNAPVKNESVWQVHLGSLVHKENIQKLKALKQQQQNLKRRAPSPPVTTNKRTRVDEDEPAIQDIELDEPASSSEEDEEEMELPADFFDDSSKEVPEEEEEDIGNGGSLPTGFFDDPEEEARIQGTLAPEEQARVNLEKDVEMFNEAMMEVTKESDQVQEQDDETFWIERHDDISREQAILDARVVKLKHMRQFGQVVVPVQEEDDEDEIRVELKSSVRQLLKSKPVKQVQSMFDDDESDSNEEEEEDWRAQQL